MMDKILSTTLTADQAGLWFLGQSGYIARAGAVTVAIDPYLTDSVARVSPALTRLYPPPLSPDELDVDIFIVTHDHLDHLDPDTIAAYAHKETTQFVGPRFVCDKLRQLSVSPANIVRIDSGQSRRVKDVEITGIYAVGNEPAVIDTAGYRVEFANRRSFYHSGDTALTDLVLQCAPEAEVALLCINGQWGNMNFEQATALAGRIGPRYAIPHHYDLMALNTENPESFKYHLNYSNPEIEVAILEPLQPFIW